MDGACDKAPCADRAAATGLDAWGEQTERRTFTSPIITKRPHTMPRTFTMPKNRTPIHAGEILEEEYRIPLGGLTQQELPRPLASTACATPPSRTVAGA